MLINSIEEFNVYVESNAGIDFLSLQPSILAAELKFLKPIFGTTFYELLLNELADENGDPQAITNIISYAQRALANLTLYLYIPIADVQITDAGIRRGNSDQSPGAFRYQVKDLEKAYLERGFQYLEEMIELMELNVIDASLATWKSAPEFKYYRALFISTGREFERLYTTIRYPRRLYTLLRTTMFNVQELQVAECISPVIYESLKAKNLDDRPSFTPPELTLLSYLKPAIAHLTIGRGIAAMVATMDENGIHILTQFNDTTMDTGKRAPASNSHLDMMAREALSAGSAWLDKAVVYMTSVASVAIFPTWFAMLNAEEVTAVTINDNLTGVFSL